MRSTTKPSMLLWLLSLLPALAACPSSHVGGPTVGSETHFLRACSETCGEGLSCVCGVCTRPCSDDLACGDLASGATCVSDATCSSVQRSCDLPCSSDLECSALGSDHACVAGSCRAPALADAGTTRLPPTDAGVAPVKDASLDAPTQPAIDGGDAGSRQQLSPLVGVPPGGSPGARHASCGQAFPDRAPALPEVNNVRGERPTFDLWRDGNCEQLAPLCTPSNPQCDPRTPLSACAAGTGDTGVCTEANADLACAGGVLARTDGCRLCVSPETKRSACCNEIEGFDCRAWPFPEDGPPGSVCAVHSDCEPGLVCASPSTGSGYGICRCPEANEDPALPAQCDSYLVL